MGGVSVADLADELADQQLARGRYPRASLWRSLTDSVLPPRCPSCRARVADPDNLCGACWGQVHFIRPPLCDRLGIPLPFGTEDAIVSAAALADPPEYDRARAVARYDGRMRTLVHQFKFSDRGDLSVLFGRWLVTAGEVLLRDSDVLMPVPLHRRRLLSRRFNQSAMLAKEVGRLTQHEVIPNGLRRVRRTRPQIGLTEDQRRANVRRAFRLTASAAVAVQGRRVLLIDDVITTGATVNACARVLKRAGATRVDVLALAIVGLG